MKDSRKRERHSAIAAAAYALLAQKGYSGTSMLNVAKAAKASNETLYRWYGDKLGLFSVLVQENASETEALLTNALVDDQPPLQALKSIAPVFLKMLLGERAILLNRAAAADPTGALGKAIYEGGREVIQPLFAQLISAIPGVALDDVPSMTKIFVHLLIGDMQIKRAIGTMDVPTAKEIDLHCTQAFEAFQIILKANAAKP
ncbi:MAG: TetR/AcrR family transcriptional regulator [Cognatishimia sp.]|uniref:TetR/AcrR family transcriptional regulator n=1 Tax=Cognatishimia sp. TaxID=2211648 RepID=UPI003B8B3375